jgi:hypothetical protein
MMPTYLLQWLDHVPDLLALSRAHPHAFPYLLESAARGPHGGHSLLLFASGEVLLREARGALEGPGEGAGFFQRLQAWYRREALPATGVSNGAAPPFIGGWFIYRLRNGHGGQTTLALPRNDTGLPGRGGAPLPRGDRHLSRQRRSRR